MNVIWTFMCTWNSSQGAMWMFRYTPVNYETWLNQGYPWLSRADWHIHSQATLLLPFSESWVLALFKAWIFMMCFNKHQSLFTFSVSLLRHLFNAVLNLCLPDIFSPCSGPCRIIFWVWGLTLRTAVLLNHQQLKTELHCWLETHLELIMNNIILLFVSACIC